MHFQVKFGMLYVKEEFFSPTLRDEEQNRIELTNFLPSNKKQNKTIYEYIYTILKAYTIGVMTAMRWPMENILIVSTMVYITSPYKISSSLANAKPLTTHAW